MNKYVVNVREILERLVEVEAKDKYEAISIVKEQYHNQDIVLDYEDYKDTEFTIYSAEED